VVDSNKKIAFCFLIYDEINHEELWNNFFKNVDKNKYEIYIHYKNNKPLKYFEKHKLNNCIETKYGDVSLIHAMNLLLKRAYEDNCFKYVFLSNSCIPLKNFNYVYDFLTKDNNGHFNVTKISENLLDKNKVLLDHYDKNSLQKSSQWFILNKTMVEKILNVPKNRIDELWKNVFAPEEIFYITEILNNKLQDTLTTTPNIADGATTFTNWNDMGYKYSSTLGLKNYSSISDEELDYLVKSKSLFGRKFNKECNLTKLIF
jgi:hypothetical protein